MIPISIRADLKPLHKAFMDLGAKQVPFATALALTTLAKGVQSAESDEVEKTFEHATPFTRNAFAVKPATKANLVAVIFVKDIQSAYLEPYVMGGNRSLGGKQGMLVPIDAATNQYGNLTRGQLARLKGKPNVFIGRVTTKGGKVISGVWQRTARPKAGGRRRSAPVAKGQLKLLIEFTDTTAAPKHLAFYERAQAYVRRNAVREFDAALVRALRTARR